MVPAMGLASASLPSGDRMLAQAALGPDYQPLFSDAMDDEFDDGSFDIGKWSWLDQGGATASESDDRLVLSLNEDVNRMRGIYQTAPAAPWAFQAKIYIPDILSNSVGSFAGLFVGENVTGEIRAMGTYRAGATIQGVTFSTPSSAIGGWGPVLNVPNGVYAPVYAQIAYDGTNVVGGLSLTGEGFRGMAVNTPAYTPTLIGLAIQNDLGVDSHYPFGWFRRTA